MRRRPVIDFFQAVFWHVWTVLVGVLITAYGAAALVWTTTPKPIPANPHPAAEARLPLPPVWARWSILFAVVLIACYLAYRAMRKERDDLLRLDYFRHLVRGMDQILSERPKTDETYRKWEMRAGRLDHATTTYVKASYSRKDAKAVLEDAGIPVDIPTDFWNDDEAGFYLKMAQRRYRLIERINAIEAAHPRPVPEIEGASLTPPRPIESALSELPHSAPPQMMTLRPAGKNDLVVSILAETPSRLLDRILAIESRVRVTNTTATDLNVFPDPFVKSGMKTFAYDLTEDEQAIIDEAAKRCGTPQSFVLGATRSVEFTVLAAPFVLGDGEPSYIVSVADTYGHKYEVTRSAVPL